MPIYEYICRACGHEFEVMQKVSDDPLKKCPHCGRLKLQKMISNTSFQLKGEGWYVTDFRDKGKPKEKDHKDKDKDLGAKNSVSEAAATTGPETSADKPTKKDTKATASETIE
jgi:putative FmdB family regulatory protein